MAPSSRRANRQNAPQHRPELTGFQAGAQRVYVSLNRLVAGYRERRAQRILEILNSQGVKVVLDVGSAGGWFWKRTFEQSNPLYVIGLDIRAPSSFPYGSFVRGSGLRLPFKDRSFDCVICNSVIEHVGGYRDQEALAEEIRRVSRHLYIVQVPAKHFPLEPHFILPFVQYLPQRFRRSIHRSLYGFDPGDIHLLSKKSLRRLFPEEQIETEKFLLLSKSYVVVGKTPPTQPSLPSVS